MEFIDKLYGTLVEEHLEVLALMGSERYDQRMIERLHALETAIDLLEDRGALRALISAVLEVVVR